jgi:hypothetical protein
VLAALHTGLGRRAQYHPGQRATEHPGQQRATQRDIVESRLASQYQQKALI